VNARHACGLAFLALALISAPGAAGRTASGRGSAFRIAPRAEAGPDLTAGLDSTLPDWPSRVIKITVTVKNIGDRPCPKSVCEVLIRNARPPRQTIRRIKKTVRALDAGDQFAFTFSVKLGLGLFEIEAAADRAKKITEPDEQNNKARITIAGR